MEARLIRAALVLSVFVSAGATCPSLNFVVHAPTEELARKVAETAELYRRELAREWLGKEMPRWAKPCEVRVKVGQIGAGGATTFAFHNGEVFGWRMTVQGTEERILDSVIPHEVSHTVFASYFRRPLPRWADEGAATLIEHESERRRQELLLKQVWNTSRRIPLKNLLTITEYPSDMNDVLTLYAEGYSLADYLVQRGGRARFLAFLDDAHERGWENAIQHHYGLKGVATLERNWNDWMMAGSPRLELPPGQELAASNRSDGVVRAQNSDATEQPSVATAASPRVESPTEEDVEEADVVITGNLLAEMTRYEGRHRALNDGWIPVGGGEAQSAEPSRHDTGFATPKPPTPDFHPDAVRELPTTDDRPNRRQPAPEPTADANPAWAQFPDARE